MKKLLTLGLIAVSLNIFAQSGVSINFDGSFADSSAIIDISDTTKGMLIPRMTQAQRDAISNPAEGLLVYNLTIGGFSYFNAGSWKDFVGSCNPPATPGGITGNSSPCPNSTGEVYSISAVTAATSYVWTVPSGASITSGQGTTSITVDFGSSSGDITVTADNSCGASSPRTLVITIPSGGSQDFTAVGHYTFDVPTCVSTVTIECWGAQGGGSGGYGGYATADVPVTPGETIHVYVGGAGITGNNISGGYNGGGDRVVSSGGTYSGASGGGASDVRRGTTLADRLIVAGGGGGAGYTCGGGNGGGDVGQDGPAVSYCGGYGGTQTAGGNACSTGYCPSSTNGVLGVGGTGQGYNAGGGGGGGGYYGGGGGCHGGGGGGSSWTNAAGNTNQYTETGIRTGNGRVYITW